MQYTFWELESHYTKGKTVNKTKVTGKLKFCVKRRKLNAAQINEHETIWHETADEYILIECELLPLPWKDIPVLEPYGQQTLFSNDL